MSAQRESFGDPPDLQRLAIEDFLERVDKNRLQIIEEFLGRVRNGQPAGRISWNKIPAPLLKRVWLDYGRGVIRNEKALDKIADIVIENIARLKASTDLSLHSDAREDIFGWLEDNEIQLTDDEWSEFWNSGYITNEFSDMVEQLFDIYFDLFKAQTPEKKLYLVDRALNIVHQRGDLAELFVQGGTKTLNEIAEQGGYHAEAREINDILIGAQRYIESVEEPPDDFEMSDIAGSFTPDEIAKYIASSVFFYHYQMTALWTEESQLNKDLAEMHEQGEAQDVEKLEFSQEANEQMAVDCMTFERDAGEDSQDREFDAHDFWLTRNGHGTGFLDRDDDDPRYERLTELSKIFGETWLYLGGDGLIYSSL
jgi:hypothetical protein